MEERKWVCVYKDACGSLMLLGGRRGYLRFTPGLQLVFVVAEPFVIEAYIFCQGADLLEPHFLCEWALYAVALMNNFPLEKRERERDMNSCVKSCNASDMKQERRASLYYLIFWWLPLQNSVKCLLTGNDGGKTMCLGELFNVPTAMSAFTGMVNIWGNRKHKLISPPNWMLQVVPSSVRAAGLTDHQPRNLWLCAQLRRTCPPEPWPQASLWTLRNSLMLISPA